MEESQEEEKEHFWHILLSGYNRGAKTDEIAKNILPSMVFGEAECN